MIAGIDALLASLRGALGHGGYRRALVSSYGVMSVSIIAQLLLTPLYVGVLGAYQFGALAMLLTFVNFAIIGIAWLSGGALRLLAERTESADPRDFDSAYCLTKALYVGYGCALAIGLGAAGLFIVPYAAHPPDHADLKAIQIAVALTGLYLIPFYALAADRLALTALRRQASANLTSLAMTIVAALVIVPWLLWGDGGLWQIMLAQCLGVTAAAVMARAILRKERPRLRWQWPDASDRGTWRRLTGKTGAGFFLHGALILALQADTLLIGWLGGATAAAQFYLVWRLAEVTIQILWKIPEPLAPYLIQMDVRGEHERLRRITRRGYGGLAAISALLGVGYALLGHAAVALWVGSQAAPVNDFAYALAGGAIGWLGLARLPVVYAASLVLLKPLNRAGLAELVGKATFTVLLFPRFGYAAVLLALNLTHALGVAWMYFRLLHSRKLVPPHASSNDSNRP